MFKRFGAAAFSRRLVSTAARTSQASGSGSGGSLASRRLKVAFNAVSGLVFIYVGGAMVAMENDGFYRVFDRYVPYGAELLEHIEQYQHDRRMQSYQERVRQQQEGTSPYIRRKYSHEETDDHGVAAVSSCGEGSDDPLSPQRFFDAQSGNIEERDYLPLVLLPDIRDPLIHRVSFALNDLIASVNASAASADTILNAATALQALADDVQHSHTDYHALFSQKAQALRAYAENSNEQQRSEHQLKLLSDEIMAIENSLVQHVNTRNTTSTPVQPTTTTTTQRPTNNKDSMPFPLVSGNSEVVLQLQLAFSQLIAILHNKSSIPLGPYIQGLKDAVASFELASRQELINNALNGLIIPDDVDLNPIINDIINS
ncbi:hypothetical protein TRICI_003243 [Trichomonascus ciferrii]|uniref:Mitofilin n=1 Tax=Trichomonascus ciferrii TaxID=44093 RepID=A0A642V3M2_9ASCO|nr:hypothetical protein TRICI_003243 [Trichomonascus ciferrii]